jgi:uncharacterized protein
MIVDWEWTISSLFKKKTYFNSMILLLSPAKTLDFESKPHIAINSQPEFLNDSNYLVKKLKKLSAKQLSSLMSISADLSDLNHQRFQEWSVPFSPENSKQAVLSFTGEVYRGLDANSLSESDLNFAQNHVRILSGLYGVLKPLDLIQPYRLEMGTRYAITPNVKNLYAFWQEKLTASLKSDIAGRPLVNLASVEYAKAIQLKKVKAEVVTPIFKEWKNGQLKTIMTYAKKARGLMARFAITNQLQDIEHLKLFNDEGYEYNQGESSELNWTFTRG